MSRIVIADFNTHCDRGTCLGHSFAVADNYLHLFDSAIAAGGPIYAERFTRAEILPHQTDETHGTIVNKWLALRNLRELFRRCRNDILVMQSSAVATAFFGMALLRPRVRKLFMIQYNRDALNTRFKRLLYRLVSHYIDGIICPTEAVGKAYGRPYCIVPDYIYTPQQPINRVPYEQKTYDFCMVGLICRDKGVIEAAQVLAGTPYRVLIAGRAESLDIAEELRRICASAPNVELNLQYLSEEEYAESINASRYCILNYSGAYSQHSSGVVFDILFRGVPVVGRACESLHFISDTKTGILLDDIRNLRPEILMNTDVYEGFLRQIELYQQSHRKHQERLFRFLTDEENI